MTHSYDERLPPPELRRWVRTSWIQTAGATPWLQRNLPTGGMELRYQVGRGLTVLGPLTSVHEELLAPHAQVVGLRFWPGAPLTPGLTAAHLTDLVIPAEEIWGSDAVRLAEQLAGSPDPDSNLSRLSRHVGALLARRPADDLVSSVVRDLMPWQPVDVSSVAAAHELSGSQLRRRVLDVVGLSPKVLQRSLRFQGYVALAQAAAGSRPGHRIAEAAALAGYADQPHLTRECSRLSGRTPRELLGSTRDVCGCGHDHSASFGPFLRGRAFRSIVAERGLLPSES